MIRVAHFGYCDDYGGASVAMKRIHKSVTSFEGVDSRIIVVHKKGDDERILTVSRTLRARLLCYLRTRVAYKLIKLLQTNENPSGRSINYFPSNSLKELNALDCDIIHFHWIGNEAIRIEDIHKLNKPVVWTFHDLWAILGSEHTNNNNSKRYIQGYSSSNKSSNNRGLDIDRWTWERKRDYFFRKKITPVAVSKWVSSQVAESAMWRGYLPRVINNPIDIREWDILDRNECRKDWSIAESDFVVVFGAVNALTDSLKGFSILREALMKIAEIRNDWFITCLIFGDSGELDLKIPNLRVRLVGRIDCIKDLNGIYCSADVVVVPSIFETFGQVAIESLSCGVPVVAFDTSGLKDIIREGFNGFLARPYDAVDLASAVIRAFERRWNRDELREDINYRFGLKAIGIQYVDVYNDLIKS